MVFNFPRTKFVDIKGLYGQVEHIASEAEESHRASMTPDVFHTAMEIMDCLHSCETALRICQEKYKVNLHEVRREVEKKNDDRGYYGVNEG